MKKIIILLLFTLTRCGSQQSEHSVVVKADALIHRDYCEKKALSEYEKFFIKAGLVDIQKLDPRVRVELKYSTNDNLFGFDAYGDLEKAYLQKDVAQKLVNAQEYLNKDMSGACLIIFDAARPQSVQQIIWDSLKMPFKEKIKYASNPKLGSLHNFGAAVDISIVDKNGKELDMGSPFDFIGELSYPTSEEKLLKEGKLTRQQVDNRKLLRSVMRKAGFFNIQTEWWHFNSCTREQAMKKYKIIE
ncbi:MAG: M15 family metallopeptidase [Bacteroidales bacterium]